MKKIIFLFIITCSASLGFSQDITNLTGADLDVGGQYIPLTAAGCTGATPITFGPINLNPGGNVTLTPPAGYKVEMIGGSQPASPFDSGSEKIHCSGGVPIVCSSSGSFTFSWIDCNTVEILP